MATQGLFTQGTSVDDLLAQRNKRATNLQQQLMNNAAQGARDPARARGVSLLGSLLGRSLGAASGSQDAEVEKLKAAEAQRQQMQAGFLQAQRGTSKEAYAMANQLGGAYPEASQQLYTIGQATEKREKEYEQKRIKEEKDKASEAATKRNNNRLADKVKGDLPILAASVREGDKDAIAFVYKHLQDKATSTKGATGEGSTADQNFTSYQDIVKTNDVLLANGKMDQFTYNARKAEAQKAYLGYTDKGLERDAINASNEVSALRTENNKEIQTISGTKATIQQSLDILDQDTAYTGFGGEGFLTMKKMLAAVGAPVSMLNVADSEQFRSNAMTFVLEYISQTKGAISNHEMEMFKAAAAGLGTTKDGNKLILNTALKIANFRDERAFHMNEWNLDRVTSGQRVHPSLWAKEQKRWEDANQITLPTAETIKAIEAGTAITGTDGNILTPNAELQAILEAGKQAVGGQSQ